MKIFDSLSKKIKSIKPYKDNMVSIFTCGPTVYRRAHLGNLRPYILYSAIINLIKFKGMSTFWVMNITDIGHYNNLNQDKVLLESNNQGESILSLTNKFTNYFIEDLIKLDIDFPNVIIKATECIDLQVEYIKQLIKNNKAYITKSGIYINNNKVKLNKKYLITNNESPIRGKITKDFALWRYCADFSSIDNCEYKKKYEYLKNTIFGIGIPGWHIECLSIIKKYIKNKLTLHFGGVDHMFSHHNNEIIQHYAITKKKTLSNIWSHIGFLNINNAKVSKSQNNILIIDDVNDIMSFKFMNFLSYYRNTLSFSFENLSNSKNKIINIICNIINSFEIEKIEYIQLIMYSKKINYDFINKYIPDLLKILLTDFKSHKFIINSANIMNQSQCNTNKLISILYIYHYIFNIKLLNLIITKYNKYNNIYYLSLIRNKLRKYKYFNISDKIKNIIYNNGFKVIDKKNGESITYKHYII